MVKTLSPQCLCYAEQWRKSAAREQQTADVLRATGRDWSSVYWHAGFAIEHILKAIRVKADDLEAWPPNDRSAKWHDLTFVSGRAGLTGNIAHESRRDHTFAAYWLVVKDWQQDRRYPGNSPTEREARDLLTAVANPTSGVMTWLLRIYHSI
jgi:hypothetical protein